MIQRIQSLFILIAAGFGVLLFFVPIISINYDNSAITFNATGYVAEKSWYLVLLSIICVVTMFTQLFMYKNRKKQMLTGKISICLWILWIFVFSLFVYLHYNSYTTAKFSIHFGAIFPVLIIIFVLLANRNIKKDEELVRSIDRIR